MLTRGGEIRDLPALHGASARFRLGGEGDPTERLQSNFLPHPRKQPTTLPAALESPKYLELLVGARGFEPPTSCSQSRVFPLVNQPLRSMTVDHRGQRWTGVDRGFHLDLGGRDSRSTLHCCAAQRTAQGGQSAKLVESSPSMQSEQAHWKAPKQLAILAQGGFQR